MFKELESKSYDTNDALQKAEYNKHYHRVYRRTWYKNNKDKIKAINKRYVENHREKVAERSRVRYVNLTDEQRAKIRERNRVRANERYATDAEYRRKAIQRNLEQYYRKKGGNALQDSRQVLKFRDFEDDCYTILLPNLLKGIKSPYTCSY